MMVALLLYGYCQGERSSRVIERRCGRDVAYRVIAGGLHPDHATIARFRARHETALRELFSQVLRLLAADGMVALGTLSLDGTKLAGNASQRVNKTLPQIQKLLAEAAAADAADDAQLGDNPQPVTPRALARRAQRPRPRLPAWPAARRGGPDPRRPAGRGPRPAAPAAAAGKRRGGRRPGDEPRKNRAGTEPPANTTDPDVRVMHNQKGDVSGYNGQLVVTAQQVIVGAMLSQHPVDRTLLHPVLDTCRRQLAGAGIKPRMHTVLADSGYVSEDNFAGAEADGLRLLAPLGKDPATRRAGNAARRWDLAKLPATARCPADAPSRPGRLQAPRPDRGTSDRPDQDLPEDDHHVPPRLHRLPQRMAAGRHRPQPAQAARPPPRRLAPDAEPQAETAGRDNNRFSDPPGSPCPRLCATGWFMNSQRWA
jgi:Transposase domain (DUF772)/Transposase DDE domain